MNGPALEAVKPPTIEELATIIGGQRWRTRRLAALTGVVGLAVGVTATLGLSSLSGTEVEAERAVVDVTTVAAERRDISLYTEYAGTLGYGDAVSMTAGVAGVLTRVATEGSDLTRGKHAFSIAGEPVIVLYGDLPVWRRLSRGSEGSDVKQLEMNLAALGYTADGNMTVDNEFTYYTSVALKEFEDDKGHSNPDGVLSEGEVVYVPGKIRVDSTLSRGATITTGTEVISAAVLEKVADKVKGENKVTSTASATQTVYLEVSTEDQADFSEGLEVRVELADGRLATGVVAEVGQTAHRTGEGPNSDLAIDVTVSVTEIPDGGLIEGPVVVRVPTEERPGVIMVPVRALVALAEGGYAVEVSDGTATSLVGVETGIFQDGWVEIEGSVSAGDLVVVPA